ncbi:MAG: PLP-dependent aminotransferase family protein [Sphaerochaetaceae bacterium]|nr:PLP-dependent aminotransferase family protein [Sphaerochaetaceae bacterium]
MLTIFFDRESTVPLYEQLYTYIRNAIEKEELKANEKLPSKRKLAVHLKISVITVETAYNQLIAEGYIISKPKVGFFVLPYVKLASFKTNGKISLIKTPKKNKYEIDFQTNQIDDLNFPYDKWAKIYREVLLDKYPKMINQTDFQGAFRLRKCISSILFEYRGIETNPNQIVIGSGSEYLISLLVMLLGRDKTFGVEEPGYLKNYNLYEHYGAFARTVGLDDFGIDLSKAGNCDVLHVTPSHQFPLGIVTPIARRMELLNWVYQNKTRYIIEDDYDSEFRFSGNPIPALKSLDVHDRVIYLNSFSKSLSPSLRISFMVLPEHLMNIYSKQYSYFTCSVPLVTQLVLEEFISSKNYERHLNKMRNIYKNKRDLLLTKIKNSQISDFVEIIGEEAGLHFLLRVNKSVSVKELIEAAKQESVRVYGIDEYYIGNHYIESEKLVILGYSHLEKPDFTKAISKLEKAWLKL